MYKRIAALGISSAANIFLTALLSLILGKLLSVEDFGITRTIAAYLVVLTVVGQMSVQDALSYRVAKADDAKLRFTLFRHATFFILAISFVVMLLAGLMVGFSGYWSGSLQKALLYTIAALPFICLTLSYTTALEGLGSFQTYALLSFAAGALPFIFILPLAWVAGLNGWIIGRYLSIFALLIAAIYAVRMHLQFGALHWATFIELWGFARLQIISGLLALILMNADIVLLERMTNDMSVIANYGLAQLFSKSPLFITSALARAYFKDIIAEPESQFKKKKEFLIVNIGIGIFSALILWVAAPYIIQTFYSGRFAKAEEIVKILSIGVIFYFVWNSVSLLNLAAAKPKASAIT